LVARSGDEVLGWAALSPVSSRKVYAGVAEVSIYIRAEARGHRLGSALLEALIARSEEIGVWTLQASIFPENRASLAHLPARNSVFASLAGGSGSPG
jgi:phosphinothricin acetyltransferase